MALRKNIEVTPKGFDTSSQLSNAYIRVDSISGNKNNIDATVVFYNDKDDQKIPAQVKTYRFSPDTDQSAKNFIAQAYEHLKTLSDFSGATDV